MSRVSPASSGDAPFFTVGRRDSGSAARGGLIATAHGIVETPNFMPVATAGTVKGITPAQLHEVDAQIVLANAYHLALRPGVDLVAEMGGLHRFMGWSGPILTDSGGYQVFSLAALRKVTETGVEFRSHIDGAKLSLSPEDVVALQVRLGVDIMMPLDECLPAPVSRADAERAAARTLRWARRSLAVERGEGQVLFGIVQGGVFADLRRQQAAELVALDFPGYAVGGLSVGEAVEMTRDVAAATAAALPTTAPRYLMGVGRPEDLIRFVGMGYDLFDCVLPTRNGRNGMVFTWHGPVNIRLARYARDPEPLDAACTCYACRTFSRAYLRHLAASGEMLGPQLNSVHNLHFYLDLMRQMRAQIAAGTFAEWATIRIARLEQGAEA
ncbi:MAG TPA: tRNA guanosine(34) transglycosylase Tgt [Candidatus Binatia bacterium]|nr:tRNA guanosine(34) transglycosylase Tgt [Candidatus Binatia bacterium]